jgi:Protein adenylyltransferase SelO
MPPTDSMEKPPTVERTGRPIAVFSNSYARLPERFFARLAPTPATKPRLIKFNESLASELGLNAQGLEPDEVAAVFAGNVTPPGAEPIAMAYAGHQFGNFVPQLGDGRAILLGEVLDRSGERRDVQLKGAGRTPFSRRGDGRAALGPVLREYLVSEAMHALGIPTTRALAAVSTGEPVYRDRQLPGAVLTRVASSHIRVGTFQYFAARGDQDAVECLSDYVIHRHFPEARDAERPRLAVDRPVDHAPTRDGLRRRAGRGVVPERIKILEACSRGGEVALSTRALASATAVLKLERFIVEGRAASATNPPDTPGGRSPLNNCAENSNGVRSTSRASSGAGPA